MSTSAKPAWLSARTRSTGGALGHRRGIDAPLRDLGQPVAHEAELADRGADAQRREIGPRQGALDRRAHVGQHGVEAIEGLALARPLASRPISSTSSV